MKWLKKLWRKKAESSSQVELTGLLPSDKQYELGYPITDKILDAKLEVAQVSRRELYDLWQTKNKVDVFPNDPNDVLSFARKEGVL